MSTNSTQKRQTAHENYSQSLEEGIDDLEQSSSTATSTGTTNPASWGSGVDQSSSGSSQNYVTTYPVNQGLESESFIDEVAGEQPPPIAPTGFEAVGNHDEVANPSNESTEDQSTEASYDSLKAAAEESGEESVVQELISEGYTMPELVSEVEASRPVSYLRDAGAGLDPSGFSQEGSEEFLPFLAALVPTLVSAIGPSLAKGVTKIISRSPRRRKRLSDLAKTGVGVLGNLSKLLETAANTDSSESAPAVDEAFVQQVAVAMEVIIDRDDRIRIRNTTRNPWRRICALQIEFPNGVFRGTGFLVGPRSVATAGHCVYMHSQGGWARKITVIPGCDGSTKPYGQVESRSFRSVGGWVNQRKPEYDYGCIVLPSSGFGANLGSFGFAAVNSNTLLSKTAVLAGYPGDKPFAELWGMARRIKKVTRQTLVYDIDTMGGQSGAPVYIKRNGQVYVVGIHNYGSLSGNSATLVTASVHRNLTNWSRIR
jgi:V8-like Glu-specific endopeptidase